MQVSLLKALQPLKHTASARLTADAAELAALEKNIRNAAASDGVQTAIGHTLGATAALETALLLSALKQGGSNDYQGGKFVFPSARLHKKAAFSVWPISLVLAAATHLWYGNGNLNPNIRITAAVCFDTDAGTGSKILKQTLKQQSGIDTRRLSRLSLIAALGAGQLKEQCEIRSDCAVFLGTPFSSPSVFEKMADNVLNHHAAMPFDFIAQLAQLPPFFMPRKR